MVEVLGRYSNRSDQRELIDQAVASATQAPARAIMRKAPKKVNHSLTQDQVDELEHAYRAGTTLSSLGAQFGQNRKTLSKALERRGVSRRYRLMNEDSMLKARSAYESGQTLAEIGQDLGVSRDTVRRALLKEGVELRPGRFGV